MNDERFTFFWRGPFSQWHRSDFIDGGVTYTTAEQYMMAGKARTFGDDETLKKILAETSPKAQKALGREVKNFDEGEWNRVARDIVYRGNFLKFSADQKLKDLLLDTAGTTLVEASPYDKIWGIGLKEDDPKAQSRTTWQGKNWLGEVLTAVRDDMLLRNCQWYGRQWT